MQLQEKPPLHTRAAAIIFEMSEIHQEFTRCGVDGENVCICFGSALLPQGGCTEFIDYIQTPEFSVKTVLNVSSNHMWSQEKRETFQATHGIVYDQMPIDDKTRYGANELDMFVACCVEKYKCVYAKNVFIHCTLGFNRSALVAGAILWTCHNNNNNDNHKTWQTPEQLIDWMRQQFARDRKHCDPALFLNNDGLREFLCSWCRRQHV